MRSCSKGSCRVCRAVRASCRAARLRWQCFCRWQIAFQRVRKNRQVFRSGAGQSGRAKWLILVGGRFPEGWTRKPLYYSGSCAPQMVQSVAQVPQMVWSPLFCALATQLQRHSLGADAQFFCTREPDEGGRPGRETPLLLYNVYIMSYFFIPPLPAWSSLGPSPARWSSLSSSVPLPLNATAS
jgi:hypothetical protein